MLCRTLLAFGWLFYSVQGQNRTSPPHGAVVVRAGTSPASGEFGTISEAVSSLPNDASSQTIFIFPGTYTEQVFISRTAPVTILGFTNDTTTYRSNSVVIQWGLNASVAGSNDLSGTLRIHQNNFKMYNVNVKNTFGPGSQAIAVSQQGTQAGFYACGFFGYQDTVLVNTGTQVLLKGYIEGAVDFIFGRHGLAYFGGNIIGVKGPGCVTANGRTTDDDGSYVFDQNTIIAAPNATNINGTTFLGRPWGAFAKVIFKNTVINAPFNQALWSIWDPGDDRTDNVTFADYNTTGPGAVNAMRPNFSTILNTSQAAQYSASSALGSDFATWVDMSYFVGT